MKFEFIKICLYYDVIVSPYILSCSNSDENFLRNIELFDKLSLRFCGRVLFIKDVVGHSAHGAEICCWTFYGHGKKVSEVECESISYGTEKKQTKIEFPEARRVDNHQGCETGTGINNVPQGMLVY